MKLFILCLIVLLNWTAFGVSTILAFGGDAIYFVIAAIWLLASIGWTTTLINVWRDRHDS